MDNFTYSNGKLSSSSGWSHDLQLVFRSLLVLNAKYRKMGNPHPSANIPEGAFFLANMAIGVVDDDYLAAYGKKGSYSDFGYWVKANRPLIWSDAGKWFASASQPSQQANETKKLTIPEAKPAQPKIIDAQKGKKWWEVWKV